MVVRVLLSTARRGVEVWLVTILVACGCGPPQGEQASPRRTDAPSARLLRVASLDAAATRFVVALGAADRLVGVDRVSGELPDLGGEAVVTLADADRVDPDLVLVAELRAETAPQVEALRAAGIEVVEVAPHDLSDAFDLCRGLGARLVGVGPAAVFETRLARALAEIGGSSFGRPRPRVAGVVGSSPVELAGGHSFVTDLIELAGGSSVTHGGADARTSPGAAEWLTFAPELLLIVTPTDLSADERESVRKGLAMELPIEFFAFDEGRWMEESVTAARRLREVIARFALASER